jgi:hypothetical protein
MKSFRFLLSVAVLLLLAAGYCCSLLYYANGKAAEWTTLIDTPLVVWLAFVVFLGAVVLWLLPAGVVEPKPPAHNPNLIPQTAEERGRPEPW